MTLNFERKLNFELDNKQIFGSNLTLCEANIELSLKFEPARRSNLEKKLQIMTQNFEPKLNFELDNKQIFGTKLTQSEANIDHCLNFEPARRS